MAANKYGNAATALYPGDVLTVWNAEAAVTGNRSQCIALAGPQDAPQPPTVSIELLFSAAPGVSQLDAQVALTDTDNAYQSVSLGQIVGVDAVTFYANVQFQTNAPFLRLKMTSLTNAVNVTAKVAQ